jgi:hypothetical protein
MITTRQTEAPAPIASKTENHTMNDHLCALVARLPTLAPNHTVAFFVQVAVLATAIQLANPLTASDPLQSPTEARQNDSAPSNQADPAKPSAYLKQLLAKENGGQPIKKISFTSAPEPATDEDLRVIAGLKWLEKLDLTQIERMRYTGGDGKPATRNRNIGALAVTDAGIEHVARLPHLQFINLSNAKVTDRSCGQFAASESLQTIGLDGTRVTDQGLLRLAKIPTLRYVSVRNSGVTPDGVKRFQIVRPDVEVLSNYR